MSIAKEDKQLNLFKDIPIEILSNYMLSENGIIYNKITKKYKICAYNNKDKSYIIDVNKKRFQLKFLLYITFIDANSINVNTKDLIIKTPSTPNKYINFSINDISIKTKESKLADTKKDSINKSECHKLDKFVPIPIKSFEN